MSERDKKGTMGEIGERGMGGAVEEKSAKRQEDQKSREEKGKGRRQERRDAENEQKKGSIECNMSMRRR